MRNTDEKNQIEGRQKQYNSSSEQMDDQSNRRTTATLTNDRLLSITEDESRTRERRRRKRRREMSPREDQDRLDNSTIFAIESVRDDLDLQTTLTTTTTNSYRRRRRRNDQSYMNQQSSTRNLSCSLLVRSAILLCCFCIFSAATASSSDYELQNQSNLETPTTSRMNLFQQNHEAPHQSRQDEELPQFLPLLAPPAGHTANHQQRTRQIGNEQPSSSPIQQQQQSIKPPIRTVNPGDRVNIPCSLANMGGSIQFAKDDQPITLDSGCAQCQLDISNDGQASLTINRVSQRDQGHWQCWRLDANGKVKQKIPIVQLVVTNSPELPILIVNDKELLGGNNLDATITIKENELVTFKCLIKGASSPVDYVHWMLDSSQNVTQSSQLMMEYSAQENNYLTQSLLKLNATKSMNLKSISCLSNHHQWLTPMTVTAFLNVLYEPSFTISREPGFGVPVSEGMSVILKCEIDSNPSSSPIWIKDADNRTTTNSGAQDQQQQPPKEQPSAEPIVLENQEDGSFMLAPAQRSDSGWYRCKTENKYGNFSSFGYYLNVRPAASPGAPPIAPHLANAPMVNQQQPTIRPPNSFESQARLLGPNQPAAQVAAISRPQASQYQSRFSSGYNNNNQLLLNHMQQQQQTNNMINNDQPANQAEQQQVAAKCRPGQLTRLDGTPEIDQPIKIVQAVLGGPLTLTIRFCCNPSPTRVFWIHRHLAMIPGRMFGPYITRDVMPTYNSFYCYESTFEIESVKPEDIGTVFVFVGNEKGLAGGEIRLQLAKVDQQLQQQQSSIGSRFSLMSSAATPTTPRLMTTNDIFGNWLISSMIIGTTITQIVLQLFRPTTG